MEIASLGAPRWISQKDYPFDWEGSLLRPTSDSHYYSDSRDYSQIFDDCEDKYEGKGVCETFKKIYAGGVIYVLFESISLAWIAAVIYFLLRDVYKKRTHIAYTVVFYWNALLWHFVGFVVFSGLSKLTYSDDCINRSYDDAQNQANTCAEEGPSIALFIVLVLPLLASLHTLLYLFGRDIIIEHENAPVTSPTERVLNNPVNSEESPHKIIDEEVDNHKIFIEIN